MSALVGGEWSDSRSDRSFLGGKNPSRFVGLRGGLEALEKGEIYDLCREYKDGLPAHSLVSIPSTVESINLDTPGFTHTHVWLKGVLMQRTLLV